MNLISKDTWLPGEWLIGPKETLEIFYKMADQVSKSFGRNGQWVTFKKNNFNVLVYRKTCHERTLPIAQLKIHKTQVSDSGPVDTLVIS